MHRHVLLRCLLVVVAVCAAPSASAFASYAALKSGYTPHNRLQEPTNKAAQIMEAMEAMVSARILQEYLKPDADEQGRRTFVVVMTSIDRRKAGAVLDLLEPGLLPRAMELVGPDFADDLLFYASEKTWKSARAAAGGPSSPAPPSSSSSSGYARFKASYRPHERMKDPGNKAAQIMGAMEVAAAAGILQEYLKPDADAKGHATFVVVMASIPRAKAGAILDAIAPTSQGRAIELLGAEYADDILFFASEATWQRVRGGAPSSSSSSSSVTFAAFKSSYTPHGRLKDPANKAAQIMGAMEAPAAAAILDEYLKPGADPKGRQTFLIVVASVDRRKAGAMVDALKPEHQAAAFDVLGDEYALDVLFSCSEATFERVKGNLPGLQKR